jgi:acetylglutamate kinase
MTDANISEEQGGHPKEPLYVVKISGNIIDDEQKLAAFLRDFAQLQSGSENNQAKKILVHGGGKLATQMGEKLGIQQTLVEGRRITDAETLKIVAMVYGGYINKEIVAKLQGHGCNAIGLSGADGDALRAHKRNHPAIDYGFVGDVDTVNASMLRSLLNQGMTPVLAPLTHDGHGQLLNTNADTIAQEVARALTGSFEVSLIYSFEKAGVLRDLNDEASVIPKLNWATYQQLKTPDGNVGSRIFAGMVPKLDNAFSALQTGVKKVIIGKAEKLKELVAGKSGTTIIHE